VTEHPETGPRDRTDWAWRVGWLNPFVVVSSACSIATWLGWNCKSKELGRYILGWLLALILILFLAPRSGWLALTFGERPVECVRRGTEIPGQHRFSW
jgi:hypothetical protein